MLKTIGSISIHTSLPTAFTNRQLKLIREFTFYQSHLYYDIHEYTAHDLMCCAAKFTAIQCVGVRMFYILYAEQQRLVTKYEQCYARRLPCAVCHRVNKMDRMLFTAYSP
jgi:hypothetical protein